MSIFFKLVKQHPSFMSEVESQSNNTLKFLKEYWFVIIFFGGMILTWGTFTANFQSVTRRVSNIEEKQDTITDDISNIKSSLVGIEVSLDFIVEEVRK